MTFFAWIPFLEPMSAAQSLWLVFVIPLVFGISVIYKALRMVRLDRFWRHVGIMTIQVLLAMIALAAGLAVVVQFIVPMLPVG